MKRPANLPKKKTNGKSLTLKKPAPIKKTKGSRYV